jgi:hypothetical protein
MKKGVALLVAVVALLSIALVAFLGTNPVGIEPIIHITSVEIMDMNDDAIPWDEYGNRSLNLTFAPSLSDPDGTEYMYYIFSTQVLPNNATDTRAFLYYCAQDSYVSFPQNKTTQTTSTGTVGGSQSSKTGQIVIQKAPGDSVKIHSLDIYCRANDGGPAGIEDTISLTITFSA